MSNLASVLTLSFSCFRNLETTAPHLSSCNIGTVTGALASAGVTIVPVLCFREGFHGRGPPPFVSVCASTAIDPGPKQSSVTKALAELELG